MPVKNIILKQNEPQNAQNIEDGADETPEEEPERYQEVRTVTVLGNEYDILIGQALKFVEKGLVPTNSVKWPVLAAAEGVGFSEAVERELKRQHLEPMSRTRFGLHNPSQEVFKGRQSQKINVNDEVRALVYITLSGGR